MTLPDGFYAVPDPDDSVVMTYWHIDYGAVEPHPAGAQYGPRPPRWGRPRPDDTYAQNAQIRERQQYQAERIQWNQRVKAAIAGDPMAARRRFAEGSARCCECGRPLASGRSRLLGLGDRCREQMPHDLLMAYLAEVNRARRTTTTTKEN